MCVCDVSKQFHKAGSFQFSYFRRSRHPVTRQLRAQKVIFPALKVSSSGKMAACMPPAFTIIHTHRGEETCHTSEHTPSSQHTHFLFLPCWHVNTQHVPHTQQLSLSPCPIDPHTIHPSATTNIGCHHHPREHCFRDAEPSTTTTTTTDRRGTSS